MKNILSFISSNIFGISNQVKKEQGILELMKRGVEYKKTKGAIIAIYKNGKTEYHPVGYANSSGKEIDQNTLFEIGSISKTFTTLLLTIAITEGKVSLEDPINKYLPNTLKVPEFNGQKITIKSLANSTSGLPGMPDNFTPENENNPYIDYKEKNLLDYLEAYELKRSPYSKYEYSNLGMGFLGYILTIAYKKNYNEILKEKILAPLNMNRTSVNYTIKFDDNISVGYRAFPPNKLESTSYWEWNNESVLVGAGGIISCADDMMKFMKAQLGVVHSGLEKEMKMTQKVTSATGETDMQIGLGWQIKNDNILWHGGGTGGFRSFAGLNKINEKIVLILANSDVPINDIGLEEISQ